MTALAQGRHQSKDRHMIENINLNLLSGGFFRCDPTWSRKANSLDRCYKVYFPVSGAAWLAMETGDYEVKTGRVYFISGFKLRRQLCARQMKVYWLHFIPESFYLRHVLDQLPPVQSWSRAEKGWPARSYENVCRLFEHPFSEQNRPRGDISPATVCRVSALLLNLVAHCLDGVGKNIFQEMHPDFYRLRPTLDFMHLHYRENLTLAKMAERAGMAPNYFHRWFKRVLGVTPFEYIGPASARQHPDDHQGNRRCCRLPRSALFLPSLFQAAANASDKIPGDAPVKPSLVLVGQGF